MKIQKILEWADKNGIQIDVAEDYAEPGYKKDKPKQPILLANWNRVQDLDSALNDKIEKQFNIEWCDEWATCGDCQKIVRTSGDSYSWKAYYHCDENGFVCGDCVKKNPEDYIKSLVNNPSKADTLDISLEDQGFEELEEKYANGWYGRNDSPKEILAKLQAKFPGGEFVFGNVEASQFETRFKIYKREVEEVS